MADALSDALKQIACGVVALAEAVAALRATAVEGAAASAVEWFTLEACGRRYSVTPRQLRPAIKRGELPATRTGRRLIVRAADVENWLAARRVEPPASAGTPPAPPLASSVEADVDAVIARQLSAGRLRIVKGSK